MILTVKTGKGLTGVKYCPHVDQKCPAIHYDELGRVCLWSTEFFEEPGVLTVKDLTQLQVNGYAMLVAAKAHAPKDTSIIWSEAGRLKLKVDGQNRVLVVSDQFPANPGVMTEGDFMTLIEGGLAMLVQAGVRLPVA